MNEATTAVPDVIDAFTAQRQAHVSAARRADFAQGCGRGLCVMVTTLMGIVLAAGTLVGASFLVGLGFRWGWLVLES